MLSLAKVSLFLFLSITALVGRCVSDVANGESTTDHERDRTDIYLLNVLPYPDERPFTGWDRAFELIPAGQLAEEQINNRSDILPGYRLNLINIDAEACGISGSTEGLVKFFQPLMDLDIRSVGVVGLYCSTVTSIIAPVAGHPGIDYISVAASSSPIHRDSTEYPRLFHAVSSSTIFNEAMLELMNSFGWKNINTIYDSLGVYHITTVQDFVKRINEKEYNVLTQTPIGPSTSSINTALDNIQIAGGKIVYSSVTTHQAAGITCEAQKRGLVWPAYAFIFFFWSPSDLFKEAEDDPDFPCSLEEMQEAVEGVIFLHFRLERDSDTVLESGQTYQEYQELYLQRLSSFSADRGMDLSDNNTYANVMYDQVWAFALALNGSLDMLDSINLTLNSYGFGETTVSNIIQEHLANLSFQGASGTIRFNTDRESETTVNILQVQNQSLIHVATYFPYEGKLSPQNDFLPDVPEDAFRTIYKLVGSAYAITIFVICGLGYVFTTTLLVFLLYWRKQSEIKASSPYLSLTMFVACYLLITTAVVRMVNHSTITAIENVTIFNFNCNIEIWFRALGLNMIFATLFVKILRIFYIFTSVRKRTTYYWKDQYMFVGVLAVLSPQVVLLMLWTATNRVHQSMTQRFLLFEDPPRYETQIMCDGDNITIWLVVSSAYNAVIIGLVVFLAVQTRNIKQGDFKDTKKVNIFVATTIISLVIFLLLGYIFETVDQLYSLSHFFLCIAVLFVALNCQFLLFVPKALPQLRLLLSSKLPQTILTNVV